MSMPVRLIAAAALSAGLFSATGCAQNDGHEDVHRRPGTHGERGRGGRDLDDREGVREQAGLRRLAVARPRLTDPIARLDQPMEVARVH